MIRFLPPSMGHFKKIQRVDCSNNLLSKVPPTMGHLKFIKELNLRYNSLDDRSEGTGRGGRRDDFSKLFLKDVPQMCRD